MKSLTEAMAQECFWQQAVLGESTRRWKVEEE